MPVCSHCSKSGAQNTCSRCKVAIYCDVSCQSADWKAGHKQECASLAKKDNMITAEEYKELGNVALKAGKFSQAIKLYTKAIELDGSNHVYYSNRSAAFLHNKDAKAALEDAEECLRLNPDFCKGYSRKAAALHALKCYDDAIQVYKQGLDKFPDDEGLTKGLELVEQDQENAELAKKINLNQVNKELGSHCVPLFSFNPTPGVAVVGMIANEPDSNTSRNIANMMQRGVSIALRPQQQQQSSNETDTVSLVYNTTMKNLAVLPNFSDAHYWTDLASMYSDEEKPKDYSTSRVVFWYPKHIKFTLPTGSSNAVHQADGLCHQITVEMARPHLASVLVEKTELFEGQMVNKSNHVRLFMNACKERIQTLVKTPSIFPPEMPSQEARQSILAKLSKETGVDDAGIVVQPFTALFGGNNDDVEKQLMQAFQELIMTRVGCVFCPTTDFSVRKAKKPNMHGCDLELSYDGHAYCMHVPRQAYQMLGGMFAGQGSSVETSGQDCKVRLV